jgi:hypothetical protein
MYRLFSLFILVLSLASVVSAQNTARLQVIHNAADPAAEVVDIYVGSSLFEDDFAFRTATPFQTVPANTPLVIGVAPGNSTSVGDTLTSFTVTLDSNQTYVAIANGVLDPNGFAANPDGRSIGFTLFTADNIREAATGSDVEFIVVHGSSDAPTVDVLARGVTTLVDDAAYGDITSYITVPAGAYTLDVTPGNDNNTIVASFDADLSGLGGGAAVVFASGFLTPIANQSGALFGIYAALPNGQVVEFPVKTARLQVIHNAADPAAASVDIYLNGQSLLDDFAFRTATPFIDVPARLGLNIGVAPGNSGGFADTLTTFTVSFEESGSYVALANGVLDPNGFAVNPDGRDIGFTLFASDSVREAATSSDVDFIVVHGATDAPTVDVLARGVTTLVDDAAYGDITNYITVPAGTYTLDVTPGNNNNTIVASFTADLSGLGGGAAVVFASGFLAPGNNQNGEAFGILAALPDGQVVQFSNVTVIEPVSNLLPTEYALSQNYPNPFNPSTTIRFALPSQQLVKLTIFNVLGQQVATLVNEELSPGEYSYRFDASNLVSGMYFYRIEAGSFTEIRRMMLLK